MTRVKAGEYQHFKGQIAQVIGVAKHSETQEEYVVYYHPEKDDGKRQLWIRPKEMFFEKVEINGKKVSRFKFIK